MTPQQSRKVAPQQHVFTQWPAPGLWPAPSIWGALWAMPPFLYPTSGTAYQSSPSLGILGSSPSPQALNTTTSYGTTRQFTDLPHAFSAMTMQPHDESWYMDTSASFHMIANPGTFHTISESSIVPSVYVGNGNHIPVVGSGTAHLSPHLTMTNFLHTPHIIKNLVSVCQLTKENNVSVKFDPFDFSVKDLQTGDMVMRCNSSGDFILFLKPLRHLPSASVPCSLIFP